MFLLSHTSCLTLENCFLFVRLACSELRKEACERFAFYYHSEEPLPKAGEGEHDEDIDADDRYGIFQTFVGT